MVLNTPYQHPTAWRTGQGWRALLLALALWISSSACTAQLASQPIEAQVKAAFLYKFGAYIDWPTQAFEKPDSPFVIAVMGVDAFADILTQTTSGRNLNGHPVEVRRVRPGASLSGVQIAFIMGSETSALPEILTATKGLAILIVTEAERGLNAGSMINFVLEEDKVRFDIAPTLAEQNNLKISARLLSVARRVVRRTS